MESNTTEIANKDSDRESYWTEWVKTHGPEEVGQMMAAKEAEAETDHLTGLLNRRGWDRQVETLTSLSDREGKPLSLLFIDLDQFKKINDDWGHDIGDQALIFVAEALKNHSRESDVIARFGGDEFALLLPFTGETGSEEVRKKIIDELKRSLEEMDSDDPLVLANISLSVGIGTRKTHELIETTLNRAEKEMYVVKKSIKNV